MNQTPTAIVVGAGAGGAAAARELQGPFAVTVLEAGGDFHPLRLPFRVLEGVRNTGLLFDERMIQAPYPAMRIRKTEEGPVLVSGRGLGGTTTLSCGNALAVDQDLRALGIDLSPELEELSRELPIGTRHQRHRNEDTWRLFDLCRDMGLEPRPLPKMADHRRCRHCGRCVLGCPTGAKWDSRRLLAEAAERGARVVSRARVERVVLQGGRATGVIAVRHGLRRFLPADLVVLAAGGLGTPLILERSGLECRQRLFVDPVLCLAAVRPGSDQQREMPMPFAVQRDGYILSPYFDLLSFLFNRRWRAPASDLFSLMIKLADSPQGGISGRGLDKPLTARDNARLQEAVGLGTEILRRFGIPPSEIFLGTLNAGHPGGMLPLSEREAGSLHPEGLPENLCLADATLLPDSLGNPPILTILALARRVARRCLRVLAGSIRATAGRY